MLTNLFNNIITALKKDRKQIKTEKLSHCCMHHTTTIYCRNEIKFVHEQIKMKICPRSTWMINELLGVERSDCQRNLGRPRSTGLAGYKLSWTSLALSAANHQRQRLSLQPFFCKHRRLRWEPGHQKLSCEWIGGKLWTRMAASWRANQMNGLIIN